MIKTTGHTATDHAITQHIEGRQSRLATVIIIENAIADGHIPATDSEGRAWGGLDILDYAIMVAPRRKVSLAKITDSDDFGTDPARNWTVNDGLRARKIKSGSRMLASNDLNGLADWFARQS